MHSNPRKLWWQNYSMLLWRWRERVQFHSVLDAVPNSFRMPHVHGTICQPIHEGHILTVLGMSNNWTDFLLLQCFWPCHGYILAKALNCNPSSTQSRSFSIFQHWFENWQDSLNISRVIFCTEMYCRANGWITRLIPLKGEFRYSFMLQIQQTSGHDKALRIVQNSSTVLRMATISLTKN